MNDHPATLVSRRSAVGGGALAALILAGGGDDGSGDTGDAQAGSGDAGTEFRIVAENIEWDLERIVVPAGREVTATIDIRDQGILHNLHVRPPGDPKTELEKGWVTQTLRFTVEEPSRHEFLCDAHPTMTSTAVVV